MMRILVAALVLLHPTVAMAQSPMPTWMEAGVEAALADRMAAPEVALFLSGVDLGYAQYPQLIDKLLPLLDDPRPAVRSATAQSLARLATGDRAGRVIDKLLPLLGDPYPRVRSAVAQSLGLLATGDRAAGIIDKLLALLAEPGPVVQAAAQQSLVKLGTGDRAAAVIDKLLPLLADPRPFVQAAGAQALGQLATGDRAGAVIDRLLPLLDSPEPLVRWAAVQSLRQLAAGDRAAGIVDKLLPLLNDPGAKVRVEAAQSLGLLGTVDRAGAVIDRLLPLLHAPGPLMRAAAVQSLGRLATGDRAAGVIDKVLPLLADPYSHVQSAAAQAVGQMASGDRAAGVIDKLLRLLDDPVPSIRSGAAQSLGDLVTGERAAAVVDKLLPLLDDTNIYVQRTAAQSLGQLAAGDRADRVVDKLLPLLNGSFSVRSAAARSLGQLATGDRAAGLVDKLLPLLTDRGFEGRQAAAESLAKLATGERAAGIVDKLLPLLADRSVEVRQAAVGSLAKLATGDRAAVVIDSVIPLLADPDDDVRRAAAERVTQLATGERASGIVNKLLPLMRDRARFSELGPLLATFGPGSVSTTILGLRLVDESSLTLAGHLRAVTHIASGGSEASELLLTWLGQAPAPPRSAIADRPDEAHKLLAFLASRWDEIAARDHLRNEAESLVIELVNAACKPVLQERTVSDWISAAGGWLLSLPVQGPLQRCWTSEERKTLDVLRAGFHARHSSNEGALNDHLAREDATSLSKWLTWSILGWALFWATFLFVFPWSRTVQAMFFWNPKLRGLFSLWFMPLLLFAIPPLRRRLLAPVRDDLIAAARLGQLPQLAFFGRTRVRLDGGEPTRTEGVLAQLRGTVVIRGDAGLGKTSTLRWLAKHSSKPVAFLFARDCSAGVDTVIARLIHDVQETGFVRSMVHAGTLTVMIDGLNEVSADTREKISSFAREMSKGNVFLSTQPIEWKEPPGAHIVDLLPLDRSEAEDFLLTRPIGSEETSACHGAAYENSVRTFLRSALDEAPNEDDRRAAQLILSNPFDLAFAADLLAQGHLPKATALIDEAFRLADQGDPSQPGYQQVAGQPFPLVQFGRHTVSMRLEDRNWFKQDEFTAELACLLDRRLLVRRAVRSISGTEERIQFRHERVWDFFIAAAFAADPELMLEHLADPRFRGSYLRIAETWEPDAATRVREQLVVVAAERGDHTTSDEFIRRLEARRRARRRRDPARATAA